MSREAAKEEKEIEDHADPQSENGDARTGDATFITTEPPVQATTGSAILAEQAKEKVTKEDTPNSKTPIGNKESQKEPRRTLRTRKVEGEVSNRRRASWAVATAHHNELRTKFNERYGTAVIPPRGQLVLPVNRDPELDLDADRAADVLMEIFWEKMKTVLDAAPKQERRAVLASLEGIDEEVKRVLLETRDHADFDVEEDKVDMYVQALHSFATVQEALHRVYVLLGRERGHLMVEEKQLKKLREIADIPSLPITEFDTWVHWDQGDKARAYLNDYEEAYWARKLTADPDPEVASLAEELLNEIQVNHDLQRQLMVFGEDAVVVNKGEVETKGTQTDRHHEDKYPGGRAVPPWKDPTPGFVSTWVEGLRVPFGPARMYMNALCLEGEGGPA